MDSAQLTESILLAGRKILIVDDDRINLRILGSILRGESYQVLEAESGEKAIQVYAFEKPELVLLDVVLPGMDGFTTCRELRKRHGEGCAPVIFVTAKTESDAVVEGLEAGGADYLEKPFREREVLARIRTHLTKRLLLIRQQSLVQQLSAANESKNRFLGMAAHDLRNPLASIRGFSEFLSEGVVGALNADQLDLVKTIHEASVGMLVLVNDLLDVATIESGQLNLKKEATRLDDLVESSVKLTSLDAGSKGTTIDFSVREGNLTSNVDPSKIGQVVENLLSNAVKYSPHRSIIRVELVERNGKIRLSVMDQGPGIADNERSKLFKDFGRLSSKPTGGEKSTGLGLAIVRKIVDAHHGTIVAENLPQRGCEFRVMLPA